MPHIIVEYSDALSIEIEPLLSCLHETLAKEPSVQKAAIKTRGIPLPHCLVGEDEAPNEMIHITLRLLPRPEDVREKMAEKLHEAACEYVHAQNPACAITAETRELDAHTYCK